jgi:serine/threonine protein kinase
MNDAGDPFGADLHGLPAASDRDAPAGRDTLELLLSRFAGEVRHGLSPSIERYARRHREFASEIRELFPLVESLERWKAEKEIDCLRRNLPDKLSVRRLGNYEIVRELGRGGMGVVFEAVHAISKRRVAVKLLPWRFAAELPRWKERLRREAETIASLRHPNIVPVFSFGEYHGYSYYVMQLITGVSLDRVIRRLRETDALNYADEIRRGGSDGSEGPGNDEDAVLARSSWQSFARIGAQVALALDYAHQQGVIHNDVKPANLLLESSGRVVVTDFGIGPRAIIEIPAESDRVTGTLRYMPPERLLDRGDARSDIYSLGVTLYELITQRPPFDSVERRELAEQILHARPVRPRRLARGLPRELETVVLKAMARDPATRYSSAREFAADLLRFANGERVHARPASPVAQLVRWCRTRIGRSAERIS